MWAASPTTVPCTPRTPTNMVWTLLPTSAPCTPRSGAASSPSRTPPPPCHTSAGCWCPVPCRPPAAGAGWGQWGADTPSPFFAAADTPEYTTASRFVDAETGDVYVEKHNENPFLPPCRAVTALPRALPGCRTLHERFIVLSVHGAHGAWCVYAVLGRVDGTPYLVATRDDDGSFDAPSAAQASSASESVAQYHSVWHEAGKVLVQVEYPAGADVEPADALRALQRMHLDGTALSPEACDASLVFAARGGQVKFLGPILFPLPSCCDDGVGPDVAAQNCEALEAALCEGTPAG